MKKANGRVGASGPGTRICLIAGSTKPNELKMSLYTVDLAPFKVKKKEENCSSCYKVKLYGDGGHKTRKKEEHLVVGPTLLGRRHYHDDDDGDPCRPVFESDCGDSSFAVFDKSTIYSVSYCPDSRHSHGTNTLVEKIRLVGGLSVKKTKCASPRRRRQTPQVLVLDGKLYVFGGLEEEEEREEGTYPWSEVFDTVTGQWEDFTSFPPSCFLSHQVHKEFYAATYNSKVIVIISPHQGCVFQHDPRSPTGWELLVTSPRIGFSCLEPLLVGSTIYWIDRAIYAYDFEKDAYFKGHFPSYDLSVLIETIENDRYRLLHIGGDAEDVFCLVQPEEYSCHFLRVRITKDYSSLKPGRRSDGKLHTSIISCSSKNIQNMTYISHVLLQDIFVGGKKKMKLESASEEMPNKDASGSEAIGASVLVRCNKKSADTVISLSTEDGSSDSEVTRSKKIKVFSKISLPFEKDASHSKVSGFPGVQLKRCSSRRADPEKPFPEK